MCIIRRSASQRHVLVWLLQPRSYHVSKEAVHELEFGDTALMQI